METEKEVLLSKYKEVSREGRRYHAVLLIKEGHKTSEVANLIHASEDTIRIWVEEWDKQHHLEDKPRAGRPKKITKEIEEQLCKLVDENKPEEHGFHVSSWDCKELKIWLQGLYGIELTKERIRKILKRNGFNYKKVNYKFILANKQEREEFLQDFKELQGLEGTLVFEDEMSSKLHPRKGYIWTREKKAYIETGCSHEKLYTVGGVEPNTGDIYTITNKKFNSKVFIQFLTLLLASVKGNTLLLLDHHPAHKSKIVQKFLENNPRIRLIYLPRYSPEFNPKENFWNYLRSKFLNNKTFETVDEMATGIKDFVSSIPKEIVKSICSYDYLLG